MYPVGYGFAFDIATEIVGLAHKSQVLSAGISSSSLSRILDSSCFTSQNLNLGSTPVIHKSNYKLLHLYLMQKHNQIKALFFLGIFSLLMLHQVVPHWHHQHEVEHSHKIVAHSSSHSHHHDVSEKEDSEKGLLDLFLELHIHSIISHEILVIHESRVKQLNVKKDINPPVSVNQYSVSINCAEAERFTVYHPPNLYFNSYLSSLDARGPPTLG